jgi:dTDP-4-amino-4,6-dideoxygalactose transaminase
MPMLSYYHQPDRESSAYQTAKEIFISSISLPIYVGLNRDDILYIYQAFDDFFKMHHV